MSESKHNLQLGKIILKNYKAYKGNAEIELSRDLQKTITIIHGEMGCGKTTILDSIHWCLYGESRSSDTDSDENIFNIDVLNNLKIKDAAETSIEIHLYEEDELRYKIKRSIEFSKKHESTDLIPNVTIGGRIPAGIDLYEQVIFSHLPSGSDWIIYNDAERIKNVINNIFPKSLSKYFLFDAELLDNFFDIADVKNIKVKDGIEKITGLPIVERSIGDLKKTSRAIVKTIKDVNIEPLNDSMGFMERKKNDLEQKISLADSNLKKCVKRLNEIESFLRTFNEDAIRDNQIRIDSLSKDISSNRKRLDKHNISMKNWMLEWNIRTRLHSSMKVSLEKCDILEKKGKIPIAVSGLALKNIIKANPPVCICGAHLNEGSEGRQHIEKLLDQDLIDSPVIQNITNGRISWGNMTDGMLQIADELKKLKATRDEFSTNHQDKSGEKKTLGKKFENIHIPEINKKSKELKALKNDYSDYISDKALAMRDLERTEIELTQKDRELSNQMKKDDKHKSQTNRKNLADTLEKLLKKYRDELVYELRNMAAKKTTEYFLKLVSKPDDFSKVQIMDNYKTVALSKENQQSKSLSAGQSCCLALSYIAAIRDIAEKNYFMVIDSPLHNISQNERVGIAKNLPKFLPQTQITLLVQDQEYTGQAKKNITGNEIQSVRKTLMDNGSIWREYMLKTIKDHGSTSHTVIEEVKA